MTITLELPLEVQTRLRTKIAHRDTESIRQLLADTFAPTVVTLLQQNDLQMNADEFETTADLLADEFASYVKSTKPALSDYAVSRAGIYEEHP